MRVLLDTVAFLWWNTDDARLSPAARQMIGDGSTDLFLSAASAWEIAIKAGRGRLILPEPPDRYVSSRMALHHIRPLPIQLSHALAVHDLPDVHQDPFDRLLIAQCSLEGLPIITSDPVFASYGAEVTW